MAVDKLVDSTQLDADLTSVANAIRTKGGTSAQMAFPAGFVSAVNAIPQGDENLAKLAGPSGYLSYRWAYGIFEENEEFSVDVSNYVYRNQYGVNPPPMIDTFVSARRLKSIEILNYRNVVSASYQSFNEFAYKTSNYGSFNDNLESVSIKIKDENDALPYITPTSCVDAFSGRKKLKVVDVVWDMSHISAYSQGYNFRNMFDQCESLEEVRFAPNTLLWMSTSYQLFNVSQVLSDASLVSIANALAVGSAAPNLKLLSTPYARCSTLMGTVTDGLFTQDDVSGTVSLADFIANTKGWTLST